MNSQSSIPYPILPIDKTVISNLGMPWFEVSLPQARNIFHGKPLAPILENKQLFHPALFAPSRTREASSSDNAAGLFLEDTLIAIVERDGAKWKYACVI